MNKKFRQFRNLIELNSLATNGMCGSYCYVGFNSIMKSEQSESYTSYIKQEQAYSLSVPMEIKFLLIVGHEWI